MSFTDTMQVLSWAYQAGNMDGIDPITDGTKLNWLWGIQTTRTEMPTEEHEIIPLYYNNRDPAELVLLKSSAQAIIGFTPVNTIPFYQFLGKCTTDATPVHTIEGINTGNLPTICARAESYGTTNKYWTTLDNKIRTLTFTQNLRNKGNPAGMAVSLLGRSQETAAHAAHYAPKFPTDDGGMGDTELLDPYLYNTNTSFLYDEGEVGEVDYTEAILSFTYQGVNHFQPHNIQNQAKVEYIFEGNRSHQVQFEIRMGKNSAIFDDYQAGVLTRNIQYKVYNTATRYLQLDLTNLGLSSIKPVSDPDRNERFYTCQGIATSLTVTSNDGITDYPNGAAVFYGEES